MMLHADEMMPNGISHRNITGRVLMQLIAAFPLSKARGDPPQQVLVNPLGWSVLQYVVASSHFTCTLGANTVASCCVTSL